MTGIIEEAGSAHYSLGLRRSTVTEGRIQASLEIRRRHVNGSGIIGWGER